MMCSPSVTTEVTVSSVVPGVSQSFDPVMGSKLVNKPQPVHHIDVTTRVRADDGRAVFERSVERSTDELHGTPGGFGFTERIPIQNWTPGLHVLEIEAKSRLKDVAPVTRRIQFEVR